MSEPRKHHIVPQLYQKGFARKTRKQWQARVLDRATGTGGVRNIRDIFAQRDYNTVVDADGNRDYGVERLLAEHIEAAVQPALDATRAGRFPLADYDRDALALFMSAQLARGRVLRANLQQSVEEVMRMSLSLAAQNYSDEQRLAAIGEIPTAETRERLIDVRSPLHVRPTNALLLNATLSGIDEVAEILARRVWTLVAFDRPCLFTAENPVVHINPSGESMGFGAATAERLYMPVSTTHALVLSAPWTTWTEELRHGTEELATKLNWAMLTHPPNQQLLLHPDVARHPLPGAALLAKDGWWPWGPDPDSAPPVYLNYVARQLRPDLLA